MKNRLCICFLHFLSYILKSNPILFGAYINRSNFVGINKAWRFAMKNLREKNQITVTDAGFIYLTDAGKEIAEMIYERHELLTECLTKLGVDPEVAAEDACRIEHVISAESFAAIKAHIGAGTSK